MSESTRSADVVKVLVKVGDTVALDQPLLELETDKAVFEMPSTEAGIVVEVLAQKGNEHRGGAGRGARGDQGRRRRGSHASRRQDPCRPYAA